jgi:carboxymethylenebutenolidase
MANATIDIPMPDGPCDSYISYPDSGGPFPAVLFFMDGFGIRPVLHRMADRIADWGLYVLQPNLFFRRGRAPLFDLAEMLKPELRPVRMQLVHSLTPEIVERDAGTYLEFLASQPQVEPGSLVGLTGYCMGGSMVVRTAAAYPSRIAAGASFHGGRLVTDDAQSPHRLVGRITAALYFGHADHDQGMPVADIERLEAALQEAGTRYQSELYEGAQHGFTMPDLPAYNEAACERHWEHLWSLFVRTLL